MSDSLEEAWNNAQTEYNNNISTVVISEDGNYWLNQDGNQVSIPEPDINEGLNNPDTNIQEKPLNQNDIDNDSVHEDKSSLLTVLAENGRHIGQQLKVQNDISKKQTQAMIYTNDLLIASLQLQSDSISITKELVKELRLSNQIKNTAMKNQKEKDKIDIDFANAHIIQDNDKITEFKKMGETAEAQKEDLDFNKNGKDGLTNSNGSKIRPRESKALMNSEKAIETADMNNTTIEQLIDFTLDMFGYGAEVVDDIFGGSLGELEDKNPFEFLMDIIKEKENEYLSILGDKK